MTNCCFSIFRPAIFFTQILQLKLIVSNNEMYITQIYFNSKEFLWKNLQHLMIKETQLLKQQLNNSFCWCILCANILKIHVVWFREVGKTKKDCQTVDKVYKNYILCMGYNKGNNSDRSIWYCPFKLYFIYNLLIHILFSANHI